MLTTRIMSSVLSNQVMGHDSWAEMIADEAAREQVHCNAAVCANYLIKLAITACLLKQTLPTTAYYFSNECPFSWRKNKKNSIDETLIASMLWSLLWIYHHNHHYPPGSGRMHTIIAHLIQLHKHIILTFFHKAFQIIYFLFLLFFLILPSRLWL